MNRHSGNLMREVLCQARRDRKKQLVVLTAAQRIMQGRVREELTMPDGNLGHRNSRNLNQCSHPALIAEMTEICRKSVAYVDHCRCQPLFREKTSTQAARLRSQMPT